MSADDLRNRVAALADEWDARDEHGNPLREGSLGEAADELRAVLTASSAPVVSRPEAEVKAEALREAADEVDAVIAEGDVAEVAALVPGEVGRSVVVARRDAMYEEPAEWLRARAASLAADPEAGDPS